MITENACKRIESRRFNLQHGRTISTDSGTFRDTDSRTFRKSVGYINTFVIVCNANGPITEIPEN